MLGAQDRRAQLTGRGRPGRQVEPMSALLRPSVITGAALVLVLVVLWFRLRRDLFWVLIVTSLVALVVGEALCRGLGLGAVDRVEWSESRVSGESGVPGYEPGSTLVYTYPDNPRGYFGEQNRVVGAINSHGFRGPYCPLERTPGTGRIALIGDSFTLGIGVRDEDTLPASLEAVLTEAGADVEVLNFGVSDTDTPQQATLLENTVLGYDPDIVVVVVFLNDARSGGTIAIMNSPRGFNRLRRFSHLVNALGDAIERPVVHRELVERYRSAYTDSSAGWLAMRSALRRVSEATSERGCRLIVALYPVLYRLDEGYPFERLHDTIRAFCESQGIEFVDLRAAFEGCSGPELWVHRLDQHPNEVAHRRAAELIGAMLLEDMLAAPTSD